MLMDKKRILITILLTSLSLYLYSSCLDANSQRLNSKDSECILCTQMVPLCKEDEELIPQSCHKCSYCKPIEEKSTECIKCRFNFNCKTGYICRDGCCTERSLSSKRQKAIRKIIEDSKSTIISCKNPCGIKCCNHRQKCIVIDQCKGRKTKCILPVLKYCSTKVPEPINGRVQPL